MRASRLRSFVKQASNGQKRLFAEDKDGHSWKWLKDRGHDVNPCRSRLHPAYRIAGLEPDEGTELCVQEAYTPESSCWGCGQASESGLRLQSFRTENGLRAEVNFHKRFQAFPGIVNGGLISTVFDCQGNWTSAIALMDASQLPKPPFTLSSTIQIQYHEPTPPETALQLVSRVVAVEENKMTGKHKVTVDLSLTHQEPGEQKKILVSGRGIFTKRGAARSL